MKIEGPGKPLGSGGGVKKKSGGSGQRFSISDSGDEEDGAPAVGQTGATPFVSPLLALQEMPFDTEDRRRAVRRGNDMLDRLEELRLGLLLGHVPKDRLVSLLAMVHENKDKVADPRIAEVLAEIELRAEVELAKLGT